MVKETSYENISGLKIILTFNEERRNGHILYYQPLTIRARCDAETTDGGSRRVETTEEVGELQESPLTPKQIYNNVPASLQNVLKALVLDALNEDVSE